MCFLRNATFVLFLSLCATSVGAADITERVKQETELDERIAQICHDHCQGNRRSGWLESLNVERLSNRDFRVWATAKLRNRHHQDTLIGGGFQLYSWTMTVTATGVLDTANCMLQFHQIDVSGDETGLLTNLARQEEGRVEKINDCRRLLRGL